METNTLPLELPIGIGANQGVESENSSDNQGRSNSSNISGNGQNTIIQTEDDNLIIDEGNSSSSHKSGPEIREDYYAALVEAVRRGDWQTTRDFLELHPHALTSRITCELMGGTVLHVAVDAEHEHIVEELVNMISKDDLAKQDYDGNTALHLATISGNYRMTECLITKNRSLVGISSGYQNELPVTLAMANGHKKLARYLYCQTPLDNLVADQGSYGASLLNSSIYNRDLDICTYIQQHMMIMKDMALDLMERYPSLAFALDHRSDISPLEALANNSTVAFESGKGMVFWKQWIYNHCIHDISCVCAADQFRLNIMQNNGQEKATGSVRADLWRQLVSSLFNLLGFKRLYEMKLARTQFQLLLSLMSKSATTFNSSSRNRYMRIIGRAIPQAIRSGNVEFFVHIMKENSDILLTSGDIERRNIFHWAVLHRQHRIFNLIYSLKRKNDLLNKVDCDGNTILHMAGMLMGDTPIDSIRGAAFQMQRELQWFKGLECICPPSHKKILNHQGFTARELFTENHGSMRNEGERWMKDTATSCTVIGTLIITIMFTAAFTIPGGNNQDTGLPILMHDKLFKLFIVTDSLSLFSSSISVLMFLGIHTSRYAEEDFLRSLPRKMIIGLFALFFSIATMMIAFSAALLLILREKYWTVAPIIGLGGVPIILFVFMQFHLLVDMYVSTYSSSVFDRKMKLIWF